jgi:tetratricopeptide (TPR) repeat protein
MKRLSLNLPKQIAAIVLLLAVAVPVLRSADASTNAVATNRIDEANTQEVLRTYLQLQEQLHATQLAIEENRKQADQAAAQNAEALANRLKLIEEALASQRTREMETMQSSNRVMLIVAGTFATLGFLAMLVMTYFQWRTVSRLAEISTMPLSRGLNAPEPLAALEAGHGPVVTVSASDESSVRLLGAIDRLEKRLFELEHTNISQAHETTAAPIANGGSTPPAPHDNGKDLEAILGRGQSLLNMERPEEALVCFDEALQHAPNHAEALVKKGIAFEQLRRLEEALQCYDKAIEADRLSTMAYLHKGALCNRLERHSEALECYENALRTQEGRAVPQ